MQRKHLDIRGDVTEIGWGNQIRSYVMQPYTMVKGPSYQRRDRKRGCSVMDGSIDLFINAYLKWIAFDAQPSEEEEA